MTLPVSFNEPTSLLQRVAEDLEYTDLLDIAADRTDSMERLFYVASYAASEYASTIGRVAKPFNPLLGETFEYVRRTRAIGSSSSRSATTLRLVLRGLSRPNGTTG